MLVSQDSIEALPHHHRSRVFLERSTQLGVGSVELKNFPGVCLNDMLHVPAVSVDLRPLAARPACDYQLLALAERGGLKSEAKLAESLLLVVLALSAVSQRLPNRGGLHAGPVVNN